MASMMQILETYAGMLIGALGKTLLLTLLSLFFAMIIGMIFALMNVGKNRVQPQRFGRERCRRSLQGQQELG